MTSASWTARWGCVLEQLESDGLADNTVVIFFGDNGQSHVRGKQFCYEEGLHRAAYHPLAKGCSRSGALPGGTVDDRLIQSIDLAPTMLDIAGAPKPAKMQGRIFLGRRAASRRGNTSLARATAATRPSMRIRTCATTRYRYIRNFHAGDAVPGA